MVAYSFQPQFVPKLKSGEKSQTIRALGRRRHAHVGDLVQIYTGMRTKQCRMLFQSPCIEATPILIFPDCAVQIDDRTLNEQEKADLAIADGFTSFDEFMEFFGQNFSHRAKVENIPFEGVLIKWQPLPF